MVHTINYLLNIQFNGTGSHAPRIHKKGKMILFFLVSSLQGQCHTRPDNRPMATFMPKYYCFSSYALCSIKGQYHEACQDIIALYNIQIAGTFTVLFSYSV